MIELFLDYFELIRNNALLERAQFVVNVIEKF